MLSISFGYENLYLMKFDNVSKDYRINYLSERLPEIIKNNFSDEDYINILYAPKIIPVLYDNDSSLNNGILINGKFLSSYDNIIISFEAFDVNSWEKKAFRSYYCNIEDQECIDNALLVCIKENIVPLFCPFYDCFGVCKGSAVKDCAEECDGNAIEDCLGVCNGTSILDCSGVCNGTATEDNCGNCNSDPSNDCIQDCNDSWGGDAFVNICNICVGGSTGLDSFAGMDCLGSCGGNAYEDCNGDCLGQAFMNECNVCVGGKTGNLLSKGSDCDGICFGPSRLDDCGVCNGNNSSCIDCLGTPFGNAKTDMCGVCDDNVTNDCIQDCNGDYGGVAYLNECSICVEGNTGLSKDMGMDCKNECWGNAEIDQCGICNGNNECEKIVMQNQYSLKNEKDERKNIKNNKIYLHPKKVEYDFEDKINEVKNYRSISDNTKNLFLILDNIKSELYNYELDAISNEFVDNKVLLEIPIKYSINHTFFDRFQDIPYMMRENNNGSVIYKINKSDFNIKSDLEKHLSLMKYQVIPVLFFADKNDKIGSIIVNSWNDDYRFNIGTKYNVDISITNQFETMVSIMPGEDSINFIFDFLDLSNVYKIYLNEEDYNDFEYVYLEFFYEHSLEADIASYIINMR